MLSALVWCAGMVGRSIEWRGERFILLPDGRMEPAQREPDVQPLRIALVCHGNIARSQVLHHYLARALARRGVPAEIFSCGTAPAEAYPNQERLLQDVQEQLAGRGLDVQVERTVWGPEAEAWIQGADLVLAADAARQEEIARLAGVPLTRVRLFYEYIGEGRRDFTDTFDHELGRQDPERFARCFDELERIAERMAERFCQLTK